MNGGRIRQPLWRDLGYVVGKDTQTSVEEALGMISDAETDIGRYRLYFAIPGPKGESVYKETDKYALVENATSPSYSVLSVAGEGQAAFNDRDFARSIDILLSSYPLDTVGRIPERGITFYVLRSGKADVAGDPLSCYFLLSYSNTGKLGYSARSIPVRDRCQNTLNAGITEALLDVALYSGISDMHELEYRLNLIPMLEEAQKQSVDAFRILAHKDINEGQVVKILKAAYPEPARPRLLRLDDQLAGQHSTARPAAIDVDKCMDRWERETKAIVTHRDNVVGYYRDFAPLQNTAWALFNAVVENEDYSANNRPGSAVEILWYRRAGTKEKALTACLKA